MRVLMTGATGLIGKETGKRLVQNGHQLVVLSRDPNRARLQLPFPAEIHAWQEQEPVPAEAIAGIDGIIHLAGEPVADGRWTEQRKERIYNSRVLGTRRIVEAVLQSQTRGKLKVFVLGSAIGFYGSRGDDVIDESAPRGSDFLSGVVNDWENELNLLSEKLPEVRIAKMRTGVVFARSGGALAKMFPVFARGVGGRLGLGQQWMSWIHLNDIARAMIFALETPLASGVFNATAPEPVRNERFTVELARALQRAVFLPVPEAAIRALFGEMSQVVLASQRVLPKRLEESGFRFEYPEFTKAIHEIAEPLREGRHELLAEQWIPKKPDEVFPYFCSETNLEELTPPFLNFHVLGKNTPVITEGTLIDYRLSMHGVPLKWQSRILSWQPSKCFVDEQVAGPYRLWHHTHEFIELGGGTLLRDRVQYKLPLGIFGDLAAGWKVHDDVSKIFSFRRQKIAELFGGRH